MNFSFTPSISKSFWYCFTSAFFGFVRMSIERVLVQLVERREDRQAADELRDEPELEQVLGLHLLEELAELVVLLALDVGAEAQRLLPDAPLDDLLEADERAAADEQDVRRVDLQEVLLRMLAPALRAERWRSCPR